MSRGYDSFDVDDFRYFLSDSAREKPQRRDYPEEREPGRSSRASNVEEHRELPLSSPAGDLRDITRSVYRNRGRTYSLRNSEIHTLIEAGNFRVVDTNDLAKFAYAGDRARMQSDIRNLLRQGLAEQRNTSVLKKESRQVLTVAKRGQRFIRPAISCRKTKPFITASSSRRKRITTPICIGFIKKLLATSNARADACCASRSITN